MIAAPQSGSGKTLITCALLQALKEKNYYLESFKCGPDYIDPMFHKTVLGISSRNLDPFFTEDSITRMLLAKLSENPVSTVCALSFPEVCQKSLS